MCGYGGMADTLASGANGSNTVQVQVLLSAPFLFLNCIEMWLSLVAFFEKRRRWRKKRAKNGAAVGIYNSGHRKCKLRSSALNKVIIKSHFTKT